jgi:dethiobiotin synthetase
MKIFVTGISTDVGKTIASAIITQALEADYWKPIQSGDLHNSDSMKLESLLSNAKTKIHPESYLLKTPASPHWAAEIDNLTIDKKNIREPQTSNHLVIEGAGGLLVPINQTDTILDLIQPDYKVVVVSRHYLGSINHTLLTIEVLNSKNIAIAGIIFSGSEHPSTESIILAKTGIRCIGRINEEPHFDAAIVAQYAQKMKPELEKLK